MFNTVKVGIIVKTKGLKGDVVVSTDFPLPKEFYLGEWAFIEKEGILIPFKILKYNILNEYAFNISLSYFNSIEYAQKFIKCKFHLPKEIINKNNFTYIVDDYTNYSIIDININFKGIIKQIINIKNNPIAEIDSEGKLLLIPFRKEFILNIDDKNKVIEIKLPDSFKP
ncbi:MAG: hypothetical protein N3A01_05170 [Bacteroidales bacterium]|nr:hypothetical protein [Bacteroidales bacterium]